MSRRSSTERTLVASCMCFALACSAETPPPPPQPPLPAPLIAVAMGGPRDSAPSSNQSPADTIAVAVGGPPDITTLAAVAPPDTSQVATVSPPDSAEEAAIRKAGGRVSRVRGDLHIKLSGGRTVTYKGGGYGDMWHRYEDHLKTMRAHIIHLWGMEGSGVRLIVDDSTGDTTAILSAPPNFSPDGTRFVVTAKSAPTGPDADYDAVEIEVWRVVPRKPVREFALEPEDYVPSTAVWRDSVTIDFIKTTFVPPGDYNVVNTPARLRRTGDKWFLVDP